MRHVDVRAASRASPEQVWTVLADAATWADWAPFDEVVVEEGQGVGQLRRVRAGRITTRERVVELVPPRRYVYEIVSGLPVRDYVAEVLLAPTGGGTEVRWQATFRAQVPGTGWVLQRLLERAIGKGAAALVRHADRLL